MFEVDFAIGVPRLLRAAVLLLMMCLVRPCVADTETIQLAAETYDAALAHYNRAEYAEAARLFLQADSILPSEEALSNAIAAARRANEHLLVARAALRASAREEAAPELAARAREALTEAEKHLSRLELSCEPVPCEIELDGTLVTPGRQYVLPGSHEVTASAEARRATQRLVTNAGATYRVNVPLTDRRAPPAQAEPAAKPPSATASSASVPEEAPEADSTASVPVGVFYASLGLTGVATGVTVWSGLDALEKKRKLGDPPSKRERERLVSSVRRTDILLAGSTLLALTTAYVGWKLVDFGDGSVTASLSPARCVLTATGSF